MSGSGRRAGIRTMRLRGAVVAPALLAFAACSDVPTQSGEEIPGLECSLDTRLIENGGAGQDGIPALTGPEFVTAGDEAAHDYLDPGDRVIGLVVSGQAWAVPHNVMWWHEIANLEFGDGTRLAVTYGPLTGSSLAFERTAVDGQEFGVSGLLFQNNLLMYNRGTGESLWPQMLGEARCGPADGTRLPPYPVLESTWAGWRTLHPDTRVLGGDQGFDRDYTQYPYGNYESLENADFLFPMPRRDARRAAKERVLGLPAPAAGAIAFPFLALEAEGGRAVVEETFEGEPVVVFWDTGRRAAMAFRPRVDGQPLTFEATASGIRDVETGSHWTVDGRATEGEWAGARLDPVESAHVAFWGAWINFHPTTRLWTGE